MIKHILSVAVAVILSFGAGAASAQDINFGSEQNRVWWNGVTPNELQELAVEAGATYVSVSAGNELVISRLQWPDIGAVEVWQGSCTWNNGVVDRDSNCVEMILIYETDASSDMDLFRNHAPLWLTPTIGDQGQLRLHRYEAYAFGTTRGRVLAELLLFKGYVGAAIELLDEIDAY